MSATFPHYRIAWAFFEAHNNSGLAAVPDGAQAPH